MTFKLYLPCVDSRIPSAFFLNNFHLKGLTQVWGCFPFLSQSFLRPKYFRELFSDWPQKREPCACVEHSQIQDGVPILSIWIPSNSLLAFDLPTSAGSGSSEPLATSETEFSISTAFPSSQNMFFLKARFFVIFDSHLSSHPKSCLGICRTWSRKWGRKWVENGVEMEKCLVLEKSYQSVTCGQLPRYRNGSNGDSREKRILKKFATSFSHLPRYAEAKLGRKYKTNERT